MPSAASDALSLIAAFADVPTPALIVDLAKAKANHARALAMLPAQARLRPHFKAHKCTALAQLQMGDGVSGVCCQTTWEAAALVKAGFKDVIVTNQVVDPAAVRQLLDAARSARLGVLVDDLGQVHRLARATVEAGVDLDVLVEVDIGMRRCGVLPDSAELLDLVRAIAQGPRLRFRGIQAYEGHVTGLADLAARRAALDTAAGLLRQAIDRVTAAGFAVELVGGGSTATLPYLREHGLWNDIQGGSYLLMDGFYSAFSDLPFEPALYALATVIHRSPNRIVLDGGLKQFSVDRGMPAWLGDPAATVRLSDEHCSIRETKATLPAVGERTLLQPRHIDPTINLHPTLWLQDGAEIRPVAVDGRMERR